ncbi:hypothetical protein QPK60_21955, partial [Aeromonas caviae]|uniref:transposase n=1 Tax=Aeromonas caviae TaxID=648 RepID=UPI003D6BA5E3|nr:hypothetical protein [Aeromonas caviae]
PPIPGLTYRCDYASTTNHDDLNMRDLIWQGHCLGQWERGLNENSNGLLRQFIPKGTDLREVTDEDVRRAEQWLNLRPRKCLGFRQPVKVFEEYRQAA